MQAAVHTPTQVIMETCCWLTLGLEIVRAAMARMSTVGRADSNANHTK